MARTKSESKSKTMATTKAKQKDETKPRVVDFSFRHQTYQIDPQRQKVYRRFVEIESARAFEIYASWRATSVHV